MNTHFRCDPAHRRTARLKLILISLIGAALPLPLGAQSAAAASDAIDQQSVQQGRKALGSRWRYPWYDGSADDVRPIRVRSPWNSSNWNANPRLRMGGGRVSWLEMTAWGIGIVLLAVLCYLLIKAYLKSEDTLATSQMERSRKLTAHDAARVEALPFGLRVDESDLLGAARRAYERGAYREAIVYLFSFELVELDRGQAIRLAKGKTNRQYLRELLPKPDLRRLVEQTMLAFEDVFFGGHDLDRLNFENCWRRLPEFEQMVRPQVTP